MIPRLERSACGCSLYTGSLILAWLYTICSLIGVLVNALMGRVVIAQIEDAIEAKSAAEKDKVMMIGEMIYGLLLGLCIIGLLINSLLLYGVYKRNFCLMMPHLIANGLSMCLYMLITFISFFAAFTSIEMFTHFIGVFMFTGLGIYFWLILYSFFKQTKDEATMNQSTFNKL